MKRKELDVTTTEIRVIDQRAPLRRELTHCCEAAVDVRQVGDGILPPAPLGRIRQNDLGELDVVQGKLHDFAVPILAVEIRKAGAKVFLNGDDCRLGVHL